MVNEPLIRLIMKQIEDTPQHWDQSEWARSSELDRGEHPCKTTFCFAGWAAFMTDMVDGWGVPTAKGRKYMRDNGLGWDGFPFENYAMEILGLGFHQTGIFGSEADTEGRSGDRDLLSTGQRIRNMKQLIYEETGVDIP